MRKPSCLEFPHPDFRARPFDQFLPNWWKFGRALMSPSLMILIAVGSLAPALHAEEISFQVPLDNLGRAIHLPESIIEFPDEGGATSFPGFLQIAERETSRQFFNLVFQASEGIPMEWSGSYEGRVAFPAPIQRLSPAQSCVGSIGTARWQAFPHP
jgi:hypothetical protein